MTFVYTREIKSDIKRQSVYTGSDIIIPIVLRVLPHMT